MDSELIYECKEDGCMGSRRWVIPDIRTESRYLVFIEVHKNPQFTCQTLTVADSSLIPTVALLVHLRSTTCSIVDCHELQGHKNDTSESKLVAMSMICLDSARVWLAS